MRTQIGYLVFIIAQILLLPFAIIGAVLTFYKQVYVSKKLGVSQTAIEIINGRATMDKFGLRKDEASVRLIKELPNASPYGLGLVLFPLYLLNKISGENLIYPVMKEPGQESLAQLVVCRTMYIDDILKRNLKESEQFVIMGGGFDTRCYGDLVNPDLILYELDQKKTQELKIECLLKANIDTSQVHFVEVDFTNENWYEKLKAAGYDDNKVTTFLWEGVTLYISDQDVRNTLRDIKTHSTAGSVVVTDIYAEAFVKGEMFPGMKKSLEILKITDEELAFGLDFSENPETVLRSFIESESLEIGEVHFMGGHTNKGTWMVVAEIKV